MRKSAGRLGWGLAGAGIGAALGAGAGALSSSNNRARNALIGAGAGAGLGVGAGLYAGKRAPELIRRKALKAFKADYADYLRRRNDAIEDMDFLAKSIRAEAASRVPGLQSVYSRSTVNKARDTIKQHILQTAKEDARRGVPSMKGALREISNNVGEYPSISKLLDASRRIDNRANLLPRFSRKLHKDWLLAELPHKGTAHDRSKLRSLLAEDAYWGKI
jgi:hypothetical protein